MSRDYWQNLAFNNDVPIAVPGTARASGSSLTPRRALAPRNMHAVRTPPERPPRVLCRPHSAALVSLVHRTINSYWYIADWLMTLSNTDVARYFHYATDDYLRSMDYTFSCISTYERGSGIRSEKTEGGYLSRKVKGLYVVIIAHQPDPDPNFPTSARYKFRSNLISDDELDAMDRRFDDFNENIPTIDHLGDLFIGKALSVLEDDRDTPIVGMLQESNVD